MPASGSHVRAQSVWIVLLDVACLLFSSILAVTLRFGHQEMTEYVYGHIDGWVLFFGSIVIANYLAGSYRVQYSQSRFNLMVTWIFSLAFAMFLLSVTSYAWFKVLLGRGVLAFAIILYSSFSLFLRMVAYRALFSHGFLMERVLIIGSGELAQKLRRYLENPFILPQHRVVAWLQLGDADASHSKDGAVVAGVPVVETSIADLEEVAISLDADMVVLGQEQVQDLSATYSKLRRLRFAGMRVFNPLSVAEVYTGRSPLELLDEEIMMHAGMESSWPVVWRVKRIVDMLIALVAGIICLPIGLVISVLIKLSAPGSPVFYDQERVGQFGDTFTMRKFRTMREDAEDETGAVWSIENDPRVTFVGRILRKFRLDELPQFWNILKGEMSLVGPRPERPSIVAELREQIPFYDEREYAMPGLTGWAQIQYPYGATVEDSKRKLEYDLFYIKNLSLSLDLQIMLRTLRVVVLGKEREP
jgi:exopolysaccharide biosynthesis polyprenyl glycosylphosphotransferase